MDSLLPDALTDPLSALLIVATGVVAGFFNVTAGGGSTLTLPLLMILVGLDGAVANGTNRVAIIVQNLIAVPTFRRGGVRGIRHGWPLFVAALPGAVLGAWWGATISHELFRSVLGGLMIVLAVVIVAMPRRGGDGEAIALDTPRYRVTTLFAVVLIGFYAGFVQAGVGFFIIFALAGLERWPLVRVHAFKVAIVLLAQLVALPVFLWEGKVVWSAGLLLAIGLALGGFVGARTALRSSERVLRILLAIGAVLLAIKLLVG
jgi:hypothetical protein